MIPKRSRFLLSMGSIAFLWLVLLGTVYFNDQVEFNAVEAKWELQEQYQNKDINISQSVVQLYDLDINFNSEITTWDLGSTYVLQNVNGDFASELTTPLINIDNDEIILDNPKFTFIWFYDSNNQNVGMYLNDKVTVSFYYTRSSFIDYFNDSDINVINVPNNAVSFAISQSNSRSGTPSYTFNEIIGSEISYQNTINLPVEQTYYDVFENIRNNASTVNPLGFMDTILSFPAQLAGYTRFVLSFFNTPTLDIEMSQQMEENINKWWWPRAIVPIVGGN